MSLTTKRRLRNPHPGEILIEDFLKPMTLSQTALANAIGVPPRRINEIVLGKRAITADTERLARYLGMSEGFFIGLQTNYELMQRRRDRRQAQGDPAARRVKQGAFTTD
jgi:antitoxin HigA-1